MRGHTHHYNPRNTPTLETPFLLLSFVPFDVPFENEKATKSFKRHTKGTEVFWQVPELQQLQGIYES